MNDIPKKKQSTSKSKERKTSRPAPLTPKAGVTKSSNRKYDKGGKIKK